MQRFEKWQVTLSKAPNLHEADRTSTGDKKTTIASMNALKIIVAKKKSLTLLVIICGATSGALFFSSIEWTASRQKVGIYKKIKVKEFYI